MSVVNRINLLAMYFSLNESMRSIDGVRGSPACETI